MVTATATILLSHDLLFMGLVHKGKLVHRMHHLDFQHGGITTSSTEIGVFTQ